jgi:hypothetical protein
MNTVAKPVSPNEQNMTTKIKRQTKRMEENKIKNIHCLNMKSIYH